MLSQNRIGVIVTWFGPLPVYFPAWLKSAEMNPQVDFFLFFDHDVNSTASNIHVIKTTMRDEIDRIAKNIGEDIRINNAYKFCDLRLSFGLGYQEYLKNYDWWGYCDIDLVFGNLNHFITDDMLNQYERIYNYGHLSLFKNSTKMNNLYDLKGGIYSKNEIFRGAAKCTPEEEYGLNRISKINHIRWYDSIDYADFYVPYSSFILNNHKNHKHQAFYWENGCVYWAYQEKNDIKTEELVYLHWQKRKPLVEKSALENSSFFITPVRIIAKIKGVPSLEQIDKVNPPMSVTDIKLEGKSYLKKKKTDFWKCSLRQKLIWIRQKWYFFIDNKRLVESKI